MNEEKVFFLYWKLDPTSAELNRLWVGWKWSKEKIEYILIGNDCSVVGDAGIGNNRKKISSTQKIFPRQKKNLVIFLTKIFT
jgi:hypothetical protein